MKLSSLLVMSILLGCTGYPLTSYASSVAESSEINQEDAMVIDGVIKGNNLSKIEQAMLARKDGTVDLVINSPGGSVSTGFRFVSVMEDAKARGVTIRCFVGGMAASMAFQILLHCNERNVLDRSFLLWHRARIMMGGMGGSPLTAPQLYVLASDLDRTDSLIFDEVRANVSGLTREELSYHFENETMHIGELLARKSKSFHSSPAIPGLYEALGNKKLPRTMEEPIFGFDFGGESTDTTRVPFRNDLSNFEFGEIIYIK